MPEPLAIEVEAASKVIDGVTVLEDVSFTALPGRVTAFLGPNGAGKSTTLRAILGIDHLTSGRATIGGRRFREHPQPIRVAGALLSPDAVHPGRTARGHLAVVAASNGLPRWSVGAAIETVGLHAIATLPFGQMSLGMRQRLGLATALLGDPAVVILDEPHNGLDAATIRWLRTVLRTLADAGRTVLVSSHLMSEVEQVADDVVLIDEGRILAAEPMAAFVGSDEPGALEKRYLALVGS
ncbi:MAG: ATP-binding cassette domain-containing protein [Nocardioidaceae bacterium]|nr:ATP-binding cassette domain-containing protein [Nocardioidaceae bacterium]